MPIPAVKRFGSAFTEPLLGLGPEVDAQVASQQSPILRSGRLQCIATPVLRKDGTKKELDYRSAFRHFPYRTKRH